MGMMWEHEYTELMRTGIAPVEQRCCVLCARVHFANYMLCLRTNEHRLTPADDSFAYRNLKDEEDGYHGLYVNQPSPYRARERGFFDCIAVYSRSELLAYQDAAQGGRWVVDQSLMVWTPEPDLVPLVGEAASDFFERVKTARDALRHTSLSLQKKLRMHEGPAAYLTRWSKRSWPAVLSTPEAEDGWTSFCRAWEWRLPVYLRTRTEALAADRQLLRLEAWLDGVKPQSEALLRTWIRMQHHLSLCRDENEVVTWSETLPQDMGLVAHLMGSLYTPYHLSTEMRAHIREVCFWTQHRSGHVSELVHMFSKALNQPCRARKLSAMLRRYMRNNPTHRYIMTGVLLAGLLGQYPDEPAARRLSLVWRTALRITAYKHPVALEQLCTRCPNLMLFCMRKCLLWWVSEEPVLRQHLQCMSPWNEFQQVVEQTLASVRLWISDSESTPSREVLLSADTPLSCPFSEAALNRIEELCGEQAHVRVRSVCYQRQRSGLTSVLHTCRRVGDEMTMNEDADEFADENAPDTGNWAQRSKMLLSPEIHALMWDWVRRFDPRYHRVEEVIFPYVHLLGVPPAAIQSMNEWIVEYDRWRMGKRALKQRVFAFMETYPYSFALYHALCGAWAEHACMTIYTLPHHYRVHQIEALRIKYGLTRPSASGSVSLTVPLQKVHLRYCGVCNSVYSVLRNHYNKRRAAPMTQLVQSALRAARDGGGSGGLRLTNTHVEPVGHCVETLVTHTERQCLAERVVCGRLGCAVVGAGMPQWSVHKGTKFADFHYEFGYTGCAWDPFTSLVYCKMDRVKEQRRCSLQPLNSCLLLGTLLWNRGWIALCPHPGCALPFVYHPDDCAYTERGYVCVACSEKVRLQQWRRRLQSVEGCLDVVNMSVRDGTRCGVCGTPLQNKRACFLYPHNIVLCAKHHNPRTVQAMQGASLCSKEEALQILMGMQGKSRYNFMTSVRDRQIQRRKIQSHRNRGGDFRGKKYTDG
jgi:hypothetical protein